MVNLAKAILLSAVLFKKSTQTGNVSYWKTIISFVEKVKSNSLVGKEGHQYL